MNEKAGSQSGAIRGSNNLGKKTCSINYSSVINPSVESLTDKADSLYTLVMIIAKRARQLNNGVQNLSKVESNSFISGAIAEFNEGKIICVKRKIGVK